MNTLKVDMRFWVPLLLIASIVYAWRLHETTVFISDVARDTYRSLEILKNRELTLIGPPASFGQDGTRAIFFGSMTLYMGAAGLFVSHMFGPADPTATNMLPIMLFVSSIPALYALLGHSRLRLSEWHIRVGTLVYALSPLTVTHARFFWNANVLIPLSVFYWLALSRKRFFIAGCIAGLMMNAHYVSAYVLVVALVYAMRLRNPMKGVSVLAGVVLMSLPLVLFELRNGWYLTNALLHNITIQPGGSNISITGIKSFIALPLAILGLIRAEIHFPSLIPLERLSDVHVRYLFPIYPVVIVGITLLLAKVKSRMIGFVVIIIVAVTSIRILWTTPQSTGAYIPLRTVEQVAAAIASDRLKAPYNITENIIGDARGMSYRYFLLRDAAVQPNNPDEYLGLDTLYAIAPSQKRVEDERRWEFTATEGLQLIKRVPIETSDSIPHSPVYVFVYTKQNSR